MATFVNDGFTGTDTTLLENHTADTSGGAWAKETGATGAFTIRTNRIYCSTTNAGYYSAGTPASPDYEVSASVYIASAANGQVGVIGRAATGAVTHYYLRLMRISSGGGTWTVDLVAYSAGTPTTIGTYTPATPSVGTSHTLKLRMVGDQISGYYDDVEVIAPVTDTSITTAGKAGVRGITAVTTTTGFHIDTVTATDIISAVPRSVALSGSGTLSATTSPKFSLTGSLTGGGTLSAVIPPKAATLFDSFASQDNAKWFYDALASVVSGQLNEDLNSGYQGKLQSNVFYDLSDSYFMAELVQTPNAGNGTTGTELLITDDINAAYATACNRWEWAWYTSGGVAYLLPREIVGGANTGTSDGTSVAYDPVAHRWLRIRASSTTVYWETSPDTVTWTELRSKAPGFSLANNLLLISSGYYGTEPSPGTAIWDNVNVPKRARGFAGSGSLTAVARPKIETLYDSFPSLDGAKWNNAGRASVINGQLVLECATDWTGAAVTQNPYTLTDSAVTVHVFQVPDVTNPNVACYMDLRAGGPWLQDNRFSLQTNNGVIGFVCYEANVSRSGGGWTTYSPVTHRYWRIRSSGTTVYGETSPDLINWTTLDSYANPTFNIGSLYLAFQCGYSVSIGTPTTWVLDNVNVPERAATLAGSGALTATARMYRIAKTASFGGTGTLSAIARAKFSRSVSTSGQGALTAQARMYRTTVAVSLSGQGVLTTTARAKFSVTENLTGTGSLSTTARMYRIASAAALPGHGVLSVTAYAKFSRSTPLAGTGLLTASARMYRIASTVSLSSTGILAAIATAGGFLRDGNLSGTGNLTVTATAKVSRSVSLVGQGTLSPTAQMYQIAVAASLFSSGSLTPAANEVGVVSRNGNVQGIGALAATTQYQYLLTTPLGGIGTLTATATGIGLNSIESVESYDLTGSSVSVQLVSPPDDDTEADFYLTDHDGHEIDIRYQSGSLSVVQDGTELATVTYDPALHQYQRMRESAGTLYFETSGDGVVWSTQITTIATPSWATAVYVGLKIDGIGLVVYDNLNVLVARPALAGSGSLSMTVTAESFLVRELIGAGLLSAAVLIVIQSSAILSGQGVLTPSASEVEGGALSAFLPFFFAGSIGSMS